MFLLRSNDDLTKNK